MERDYRGYGWETTIVEKFEEYEKISDNDFGDEWDDFSPWFLCFRAGFEAGGNS